MTGESAAALVAILAVVGVGGWILARLLAPASAGARDAAPELSVSAELPSPTEAEEQLEAEAAAPGEGEPETALDPDTLEALLVNALEREPQGEEAARLLSDMLLTLELVVPAPSIEHATTWLMNQGPPQFGLMPHPAAVERVARHLPAMVAFVAPERRQLLVDSGVEVLLRSIEWRRAEELHHLLIHLLGELGDESTLPVLDQLALERSFDDDEKKALVLARGRIDGRLMARRGRLSLSSDGGELSLLPASGRADKDEGPP